MNSRELIDKAKSELMELFKNHSNGLCASEIRAINRSLLYAPIDELMDEGKVTGKYEEQTNGSYIYIYRLVIK